MDDTAPHVPRAHRLLRVVHVLAGLVAGLCLLAVFADAGLLFVLWYDQAHDAWYFPLSVFLLPVLLASGAVFLLTRHVLRRRRDTPQRQPSAGGQKTPNSRA